jgi:hypothetical protein
VSDKKITESNQNMSTDPDRFLLLLTLSESSEEIGSMISIASEHWPTDTAGLFLRGGHAGGSHARSSGGGTGGTGYHRGTGTEVTIETSLQSFRKVPAPVLNRVTAQEQLSKSSFFSTRYISFKEFGLNREGNLLVMRLKDPKDFSFPVSQQEGVGILKNKEFPDLSNVIKDTGKSTKALLGHVNCEFTLLPFKNPEYSLFIFKKALPQK